MQVRIQPTAAPRRSSLERPAAGAARSQASTDLATLERAGQLGHDFGRVRVSAPSAAAQPIQAAGLHEGYLKAKGALVSARKAVGGIAGKVAGAVKGTKAYQAGAGLVGKVKDKKQQLSDTIKTHKYYEDLQKIGEDSGFRKLRGVMGVLGLAGGYEQGFGEKGIEGRRAFQEGWEKHFASIESPKKRAAAEAKYSLGQSDERLQLDQAQADWKTRQRAERYRRVRQRQSGTEPQGLEMQDMAQAPSSRFGNAPFLEVEQEDDQNL